MDTTVEKTTIDGAAAVGTSDLWLERFATKLLEESSPRSLESLAQHVHVHMQGQRLANVTDAGTQTTSDTERVPRASEPEGARTVLSETFR